MILRLLSLKSLTDFPIAISRQHIRIRFCLNWDFPPEGKWNQFRDDDALLFPQYFSNYWCQTYCLLQESRQCYKNHSLLELLLLCNQTFTIGLNELFFQLLYRLGGWLIDKSDENFIGMCNLFVEQWLIFYFWEFLNRNDRDNRVQFSIDFHLFVKPKLFNWLHIMRHYFTWIC